MLRWYLEWKLCLLGQKMPPHQRAIQCARFETAPTGLFLDGAGWLAAWVFAGDSATQEQLDFFENRIRPVLIEHCFECHSDDAKTPKGGLRLDSRAAVLQGGDSGAAVVPGHAEQSILIEAVRYESLKMPPQGKLPEAIVSDLVNWVAMGAPDPRVGETIPVASRTYRCREGPLGI